MSDLWLLLTLVYLVVKKNVRTSTSWHKEHVQYITKSDSSLLQYTSGLKQQYSYIKRKWQVWKVDEIITGSTYTKMIGNIDIHIFNIGSVFC